MRLICPNCGAQYEVDARVIPDTGRDVQCSNCGHTWFQNPAHLDDGLAEEQGFESSEPQVAQDADKEIPVAEPLPEDSGETLAEAASTTPDSDFVEPELESLIPTAPAPETAAEPEPDLTEDLVASFVHDAPASDEGVPEASDIPFEDDSPITENDDDFDEDYEAEPEIVSSPAMAPQSSGLKESVRDILRAEVEFDQSLRQSDPDTLETQPDLGLEEPSQDAAKKSLRDRMARLRGLDPADPGIVAGSVAAASGKRRDLLPDIEEINSTLSASSERDDDGTVPDEDTRRARAERSGFRTGFTLLILIAAMLVGLYVLAPLIAAKIPALADTMDAYVAMANGFRIWLDQVMTGASARLNALLGQLTNG